MKTIPRDGGRNAEGVSERARVTNWGCGCGTLYSQRDQVGREDPHSLSGREPPAETEEKRRLQKTNTSVGEAHFLARTGLPLFKQCSAWDGKPPTVPQSGGWRQTGGKRSYLPKKTSTNILDITKGKRGVASFLHPRAKRLSLQLIYPTNKFAARKHSGLRNCQDITFVQLEWKLKK